MYLSGGMLRQKDNQGEVRSEKLCKSVNPLTFWPDAWESALNQGFSWRQPVLFLMIFILCISPFFISSASALKPGSSQAILQSAPAEQPKYSPQLIAGSMAPAKESMTIVPNGPKVCPNTVKCVYVADGAGFVSVIEKTKLIATIPVKLTTSDPYTCPESTYFWFDEILVADPCGNNSAGELRTLNVSTNKWGSAITIAGNDPVFMVGDPQNGELFITDFGYSEVTVLSSPTKLAKTISTCGTYPESSIYDKGNVYESNQKGYDQKTGNYAGCIDEINGSTNTVTATLWGDATNGPGTDGILEGISILGNAVYVNCELCYNSTLGTYGEVFFTTTNLAGWSTHNLGFANTYILWGSIYDPAKHAVAISSPYAYSYTTPITIFINASKAIIAQVNATGTGCYNPADKSLYGLASSSSPSSYYMISPKYVVKTIVLSYGELDPSGCAAN